MTFDPIETADEIVQSYSTDFIGERHVAFRNILNRYGNQSSPFDEKIQSFVKMKGPYIQAIKGARWSQKTWEEFARSVETSFGTGLDSHIINLFSKMGFKRLHSFQEEAMTAILQDSNTLVVAGTGRGKTEAWLIPLFEFILRAKRGEVPGHPPNSVKAVLIYPTKSLAQDQLKRLIKYLVELNPQLPEKERITVGVYDGDTPSDADPKCHSYLGNAFRYFKCPMYDGAQQLCIDCDFANGHSLVVEKGQKDKLRLMAPTPQCRTKCPSGTPIPLDFISLTRETIKEDKVDILLTNPDILNYRLVNVNAEDERTIFLKEPKFFVLDEVHTYTGLFGSFVSMIMKRTALVRRTALESDDLRIIAASATVRNKEEVYGKIAPFAIPFTTIEEEVQDNPRQLPLAIPGFFTGELLSLEGILAAARGIARGDRISQPYLDLFRAFGITKSSFNATDDVSLDTSLKESLYERLTLRIEETPDLDFVRAVHTVLASKPLTMKELTERLSNHYSSLDRQTVASAIHNFIVVSEISGMLESRVHLFSWPLDGYYSCVNCAKVYDSPQQECSACHFHFVTKLVMCRRCDEEAYESWFCPYCQSLYTVQMINRGEEVSFRPLKCSCTGTEHDCIKTVWRPYFRCTGCKKVVRVSSLRTCAVCKADMVLDQLNKKFVCSNPYCKNELAIEQGSKCPYCKSELRALPTERLRCLNCGRQAETLANNRCQCGASMYPTLSLPWICNNESCGETWMTPNPPPTCTCKSRTFHLAGIFEIISSYECPQCKGGFVLDNCGKPRHQLHEGTRSMSNYMLLGTNFMIEDPKNSRKAVPCYHPRARYGLKGRYDHLAKSTANVLVTSAQYALRHGIGHPNDAGLEALLEKSKLLSFSDSNRDMEALNRFFQEPESELFIDQLVTEVLIPGPSKLSEMIADVHDRLKWFGHLLGKQDEVFERLNPDAFRKAAREQIVKYEVERRILPGSYWGSWLKPQLVENGLVNARLDLEGANLTKEEMELLQTVYKHNNIKTDYLSSLVGTRLKSSFNDVLKSLLRKELLIDDDGRINVNPEKVTCVLVSRTDPILWDPATGDFLPEIAVQLGETSKGYIDFDLHYSSRNEVTKPGFNRTSFRVGLSKGLLLWGEVYRGSTEKTKRRELEFQFKNGLNPNFLSTGPAMELGVDIGDLDILFLHGTPPNVNSYLQRVGRAGRESHKSLVFSVSKRNPIDYYYYNNPVELIQSKSQPVPLVEHNPEVLAISLNWAILDYIANNWWVPWRAESRPDGDRITDGEETVRIRGEEQKPDDIVTLFRVYYSSNKEIDFGDRLKVLAKIVNDYRTEVQEWLRSLLSYNYCSRCEKHYSEAYVGPCETSGCGGSVRKAADVWEKQIDSAINEFPTHLVSLAREFDSQLKKQDREFTKQKLGLLEAEDSLDSNENKKQENTIELEGLENRLRGLSALRVNLARESYADFHRNSVQSKYAFNIRSSADVVSVTNYKENSRTGKFEPSVVSRDIEMALRENPPYGVNVLSRKRFVTCKVSWDEWHTTLLSTGRFGDKLVCVACYTVIDDLSMKRCNNCGGALQILRTLVPASAQAYPEDYPLRPKIEAGKGFIQPTQIFALGLAGQEVRRTYPILEDNVEAYSPSQSWDIVDKSGNSLGSLEYGELKLLTSTMLYQTVYEGFSDPRPRLYEMCGEEGCDSVVVQVGQHVCAANENHDPTKKRYVRLAYMRPTYGLRIQMNEDPDGILSHSLAHGFRLALQNIAGVQIRDVGEVVEGTSTYVFDADRGGSGVTRLLIQPEGGNYPSLNYGIQIVKNHMAHCACEDGCPNCLYQFGCTTYNSPITLSRIRINGLLDKGLRLVERNPNTP